jgi:DNA-binding SARP family transcriptional activator
VPFEIQFFGNFKAARDGEAALFPTHPTANLCAYLAFHAGKTLTREDVGAAIWPSVDPEKAQNRLRTALVHLRQALDPWQPVQADRQTVSFDMADGHTDLLAAESLYRQSRLAQGQEEERRSLEELIAIIDHDFLEGWAEEWVTLPRELWRNNRTQAAVRLGHIYLEMDFAELVVGETERVFAADPFQEEAWALHLRAMIELERGREGSEQFRSARRRLREEMEFDFSPELLDLARRVAAGQVTKKTAKANLSASEKDVVSRAFEGQLTLDPYALLPILTGEAFRAESMTHPMESWQLIQRVIGATEGIQEERIQLMVMGMNLAGMVDDIENGLDYGEWVIENLPESNPLHGRALSTLGFFCFEVREWESAKKYIARNVELTEAQGKPEEIAFARSQLASLLWHEGDLDSAEEIYKDCARKIVADESVRGRYNNSIIAANLGFVMSIRQDWEQAEQYFERCHASALANKFDYVRGTIMGPLAAARMANGKPAGARQMASLSLAQTYRSRYRRMNQISADYAAITLIYLGHQAEGISLLDRFAEFRKRDRHERSVAEEVLTVWTKELARGAEPLPAWERLSRPSEVIARACDLLDQM